jgi:hypothetical protein
MQRLISADENIWVSYPRGWNRNAELIRSAQFHRQVAYQLLFWTIVHTTAHYVNFINVSAEHS